MSSENETKQNQQGMPAGESGGRRLPHESDGLGAIGNGRIVIGYVPAVNGEEAVLVEDFQPTRHELGVLARHYLDEACSIEFEWRCSRQSGSYEIRMLPFAQRRLAAIREAIGEDVFGTAVADVEREWDAKFAEADECERQLPPCTNCGEKQTLEDAPYVVDGMCCRCRSRAE